MNDGSQGPLRSKFEFVKIFTNFGNVIFGRKKLGRIELSRKLNGPNG
jgi:hypothetical protein